MNTLLPLTVTQSIWALMLGGQALLWLSRGGDVLTRYGSVLAAIVAVYAVCIIALHRRSRAAWWLCWIPSITSLAIEGPWIFYNLALMWRGDDLYRDSPGTGIVVYLYAMVFVAVPISIMALLVWVRRGLSPN